MLVWHYVLHDLPAESPYLGGVYWGKLVFPKEYPLKPPAIYMLTPSGRFETNMRLCLSMSDFHPESWNPSWRIESILMGLVSFMLDPSEPRTTGGVHTSPARRREYAKTSFEHNRVNAEFRELFPEFCDESKRCEAAGGGFFLAEPPAAAFVAAGAANRAAGGGGAASLLGDAGGALGAGGRVAPGAPGAAPGDVEGARLPPLLTVSVIMVALSCIGYYLFR